MKKTPSLLEMMRQARGVDTSIILTLFTLFFTFFRTFLMRNSLSQNLRNSTRKRASKGRGRRKKSADDEADLEGQGGGDQDDEEVPIQLRMEFFLTNKDPEGSDPLKFQVMRDDW